MDIWTEGDKRRAEREARARSEARRAASLAAPKCQCGNQLGLANTTGLCGACEYERERLVGPFNEAKAAVNDETVFSPDQITALHDMLDALCLGVKNGRNS